MYVHILVDCGSLVNPANGQVSLETTFEGSVANYSCNQTYVLCGTECRVCQSNGSWSGTQPDCISKFYLPKVAIYVHEYTHLSV